MFKMIPVSSVKRKMRRDFFEREISRSCNLTNEAVAVYRGNNQGHEGNSLNLYPLSKLLY